MKTLTEHNKDVIAAIAPTPLVPAGVLCPDCNTEMSVSTLASLNDDQLSVDNGDVSFIPMCNPSAIAVECTNCQYQGFKL